MAIAEFVVNFIEKTAGGSSAVDTMIQSNVTGVSRYELANNSGQIVASVLGMIKILSPIGIQLNTIAGTMTFLKIVVDVKNGQTIQSGDVLNLIGNVAGVVASVAVLSGTLPLTGVVAGGIAVGVALGGVLTADGGLRDFTMQKFQEFFSQSPVPILDRYWLDGNGVPKRYDDIVNDPSNPGFLEAVYHSGRTDVEFRRAPNMPTNPDAPEEVDGDGQQ